MRREGAQQAMQDAGILFNDKLYGLSNYDFCLLYTSTQRPGHAHSIQSTVIQIFLFIRDDLQRHTGKIHARQGIQLSLIHI